MTEKRSDEVLLTQFKAGDDKAFNELVGRYEKHLIGFLFGISANIELSKDVCQDTFLKMIKNPPGFFFGGKVKAWLFRTAKNQLIDHMRRNAKSQPIDESVVINDDSLPNPHESIALSDDITEIQKIITELEPNYKEIVIMHFFGGMTFREIGENLNIPLGTALWRMKKALSIMQEIYEKRSDR